MPSDSSNYKIHIFSTMGQSSLAVENQIDVVKRHNITSQYVVTKGLYPSGKIEKDKAKVLQVT